MYLGNPRYADTVQRCIRPRHYSCLRFLRISWESLCQYWTFMESAERDAKDLQADPSPVEAKVLAVHQPPPLCHQCGGKHLPSAC